MRAAAETTRPPAWLYALAAQAARGEGPDVTRTGATARKRRKARRKRLAARAAAIAEAREVERLGDLYPGARYAWERSNDQRRRFLRALAAELLGVGPEASKPKRREAVFAVLGWLQARGASPTRVRP